MQGIIPCVFELREGKKGQVKLTYLIYVHILAMVASWVDALLLRIRILNVISRLPWYPHYDLPGGVVGK